MSETRAKGCLLAAVIWCVILAVLGVAYKFLVHPYLSEKLKGATGSASQYKTEIVIAADSFSGYCILRSDAVKQELKAKQIKLNFQDDKADYAARLKALQNGKAQLAVFTIDSLITAGAKAGDFPASIVLVIDETKGGDAIVAYQSAIPSLQSLNDPDARIVLTPNSPSEFLARVVVAHFNLPRLSAKWWVEADGASAVFKMFRSASPNDKKAYALWEPYVSKALEKKGTHILLDSSKLKGYIVDVLVVERQFLRDHPDSVKAIVEAYCRAAYAYNQQPAGMINLVIEDARKTGAESLDEPQAKQVVQGIQWKNTLENYGHFGLASGNEQSGVQHLEDIIGNIIDVLIKTQALPNDPLGGKHHTLFYNQILAEMRSANFHPGKGLNLIAEIGSADNEKVRTEKELTPLAPEQWANLRPVGELKLEPIVFVRGSAGISVQSERDLQELARRLQSFPQFYLRVVGHARAEGDPEANRQLAQARAEAAAQFLIARGVNAHRIKTEGTPSTLTSGEAQAVSFVVGQVPY
jgi:outer membrane protein OmpA-like peptidoglycan-associated protein/ABC-type taurine transport system substrate-binding protein